MKTKGIRIFDIEDGVISVTLLDILQEVFYGAYFYWSILYLEAIGHLGEGKSVVVFADEILTSERGIFIKWGELNVLAKKFSELIDIILIGCKNEQDLRKYEKNQDMFETCDIVIQMIDSSFWEIFSKDEDFIKRLAEKFKDIKFIESDYIP